MNILTSQSYFNFNVQAFKLRSKVLSVRRSVGNIRETSSNCSLCKQFRLGTHHGIINVEKLTRKVCSSLIHHHNSAKINNKSWMAETTLHKQYATRSKGDKKTVLCTLEDVTAESYCARKKVTWRYCVGHVTVYTGADSSTYHWTSQSASLCQSPSFYPSSALTILWVKYTI